MIELYSQYKVEEPFVQQNDHFEDKGGYEEEMYNAELVAKNSLKPLMITKLKVYKTTC